MKIKVRLLGSVALIFLIVVSMFLSTWLVTSSQKNDSLVVNLAGRQRMLSQKVAKEILAYEKEQRAELAKQINTTIQVFETTLASLTRSGDAPLTLNPKGPVAALPEASDAVRDQLVTVAGLWKPYKEHIQAVLAGGPLDEGLIITESMDVLKAMNKAVVMMQGETEARVTTLLVSQSICVAIGVIIFLGVLFALNTHLARPLSRLETFAREIAGGNLDAQIQGRFIGELAALKDTLGVMVGNLRETMESVASERATAERNATSAKQAADEANAKQEQVTLLLTTMSDAAGRAGGISESVAAAAGELAAQVDEVNHGTGVQRDRMAETATAMEEMNATVLEVARNASNAAEAAGRARENAQTGADGVREAVSSFDAVKDKMLHLNESMGQLGEQAENIGNIMNVVTDIADQTNLLALNAAIEAARAGEAGRGFAVVADEVRKLAEKTMSATKEVGDAVGTIQEQARSNIKAVEESVEDIVKSTEAANESGRFMSEIVSIVGETAGMVESIATASEEQSAASEEINMAVSEVTSVANETADGMARAAKSLEHLSALAADLDVVIRDMSGQSSAMLNPDLKSLDEIEADLKAQGRRMSDRSNLKAADPDGVMQWGNEFSTNIREIDEQHLRLVDLINALQKAMRSGQGRSAIKEVLEELKQYTVFHFAHEESLFEKYGYPESEAHANEHKMFVDKVLSFEEKILSGRSSVTSEVLDFLKQWLTKHIKVVDRAYSPYMNGKGLY